MRSKLLSAQFSLSKWLKEQKSFAAFLASVVQGRIRSSEYLGSPREWVRLPNIFRADFIACTSVARGA